MPEKSNSTVYVWILKRVKWRLPFLFLITFSTISRMSRSGQSPIVTGANGQSSCRQRWTHYSPAAARTLRGSGSLSNTRTAVLPAAVMVFRWKIHPYPFQIVWCFCFVHFCRSWLDHHSLSCEIQTHEQVFTRNMSHGRAALLQVSCKAAFKTPRQWDNDRKQSPGSAHLETFFYIKQGLHFDININFFTYV